ncbi:MAG: nitrile hydratase subunit beta [Gammaproteobacteria bacterium]|nr:nitrile hydratase subunit beta [Gammaproteobacteria bacterium]
MSKPHYDTGHHIKKAKGVGDPQCFSGEAGKPKFKVGDRVRIKNLPDIFYTRCQMYTRGAEATVAEIVYESPAPEDEAWDNTEHVEWFYSLIFKQKDLWPEYPDAFADDTLETELSERWLEPA